MNNLKNILWGLLLILVGIIVGLNAFEITNINIFFDGWWTLFIIVPCLFGLITEKEKTGNIIGLLIGIFLLLSAQGIVEFEIIFKLIFPTILIILGLSLVFKNTSKKDKAPDVENELEYTATFSSQTLNFDNEKFNGCDMDAIFGGIKCNLVKSDIKDKSVINALALFGGINFIVPKEIKLIVKSTSIFGGVSNNYINNENAKKTIYINATCLFGGININDESSKDN